MDLGTCWLGGVWTQGSMDSGTCGLGDYLSFEICGPGNTWTQGCVGLGTCELREVWTRGRCGLRDVRTRGHLDLRMWTWGQCGLWDVWDRGRVELTSCGLRHVWTLWFPEKACQQYVTGPSVHGSAWYVYLPIIPWQLLVQNRFNSECCILRGQPVMTFLVSNSRLRLILILAKFDASIPS